MTEIKQFISKYFLIFCDILYLQNLYICVEQPADQHPQLDVVQGSEGAQKPFRIMVLQVVQYKVKIIFLLNFFFKVYASISFLLLSIL